MLPLCCRSQHVCPAAYSLPMSVTFYYHGGVPNKKPGDHILPAAALGLNYTWAYRDIP